MWNRIKAWFQGLVTWSFGSAATPGKNLVGVPFIIIFTIYLAFVPCFLIRRLYLLWPSCECPPKITSVNPASGKLAGGNTVVIRGKGFSKRATVYFGSDDATNVQVKNSAFITVTAPEHKKAETVSVIVQNTPALADVLTDGYQYTDTPPTPSSPASPSTGSAATPPAPNKTGSQAGLKPAAADGSANKLAPIVTAISPKEGSICGGDLVKIIGTGFAPTATVTFGGEPATDIQVEGTTTITATAPSHPLGKVAVVVVNDAQPPYVFTEGYTYTCPGPSPLILLFMVMLAGGVGGALHALRSFFWYVGNRQFLWSWVPMYIVLPINGAAMALIFYLVVLAGFYKPQGSDNYFLMVGLGAVVGMFSQQASEKLKQIASAVLTPADKGKDTVPPGGSAPMEISKIDPLSGPKAGGQEVTITGKGFSKDVTVTFGGVKATDAKVINPQTIKATTPSAPNPGDVVVTVTDSTNQSVSRDKGYTYT